MRPTSTLRLSMGTWPADVRQGLEVGPALPGRPLFEGGDARFPEVHGIDHAGGADEASAAARE